MVSLNPNGGVKHSVAFPCRWPKFNHCVRLTALKAICNGQAGISLFSMEVGKHELLLRGWVLGKVGKLEKQKSMEFFVFFFFRSKLWKFPGCRRFKIWELKIQSGKLP